MRLTQRSRTIRFSLVFLIFLITYLCVSAQSQVSRTQAETLQREAEDLLKSPTAESRRSAVEKLSAAEELWKQSGDQRKRADSLKLLVETLGALSDTKRALAYSETLLPIAASLGDKTLEGETMSNIGAFHDILGDTRKGLPFVEKAAVFFGDVGDTKRQAIALNAAGILYSNIGEMEKAMELLNRSLSLRRESKDVAGEARTLINIGTIYDDTGEKRKAAAFYEQGLEIILTQNDPRTQAVAMNNLALICRQLGEYQKAIDLYERALALRRQVGDKRGEAITIANIGSVYRSLGEPNRTLEMLNESLAIYRAGGFKRNEARTLSSIGSVYSLLDDQNKSLEFHQKALDIERSIDNKQGQAIALTNVASIYGDMGRAQEALPLVEESLKLARSANDNEQTGDVMLVLARTYQQLNRIDEAAAAFDEAIKINRQTEMPLDIAEALYHSARFDEKNRTIEAAIQKMVEVLNIIEDVRNTIVAPNLRSTFLADQQKYFDFYLTLTVAQHRKEPKKGFDAIAFRISERARARSLLESLGEAQKEIRSGTPPALVDRESTLRQTISAKETQRITSVRQNNKAAAAEYERDLARLVDSYRDVQTDIRKQNPQLVSLIRPEPLELHEVQANVLDDNSVLLEYFLGTYKSFLFVVTKSDVEIVELPNQEIIEKAARETLAAVRARGVVDRNESPSARQERINGSDSVLDSHLAALYSMLVAPIADRVKNKRLLIVGSDVLQYFPFAILKPSAKTGDGRYLIETNEIVNLPSASAVPLLRLNYRPRTEFKNLVSVIADPVFSNDDSRLKILAAKEPAASAAVMREAKYLLPAFRSDFSRLRFSRLEAEAIAGLAPYERRMVALDFAANIRTATGPDVQGSKIVHFATHGMINSQFPELSGLVFSLVDENGESQNGYLRLADIYNMRFDADLVVLSACETALGKEIKGEGIVGLTRGVMYAGAPSVLASLWRVEDRATADLMKRFYGGILKDGISPASALRSAQRLMIKEKGTSHPFFWAGFSLQGDWQNRK